MKTQRLLSGNMKDYPKQVPPVLEIAPMRVIRKPWWADCSIADAAAIMVPIWTKDKWARIKYRKSPPYRSMAKKIE